MDYGIIAGEPTQWSPVDRQHWLRAEKLLRWHGSADAPNNIRYFMRFFSKGFYEHSEKVSIFRPWH